MSDKLPNSLQRLIRNILDNDAQIKKVKHMETPIARISYEQEEDVKPRQQADEEEEMDDIDDDDMVQPKPKRMTRKERNSTLTHQYMEEVALGNLKYKDANGRNRTTTYKKWVSKNKAPKYDEDNECWTIPDPDMYGKRALAQKTVGSLFMKMSKCKLSDMQGAVTAFLNQLNGVDDIVGLLETPHIAGKALQIMSDWYSDAGATEKPRSAKRK